MHGQHIIPDQALNTTARLPVHSETRKCRRPGLCESLYLICCVMWKTVNKRTSNHSSLFRGSHEEKENHDYSVPVWIGLSKLGLTSEALVYDILGKRSLESLCVSLCPLSVCLSVSVSVSLPHSHTHTHTRMHTHTRTHAHAHTHTHIHRQVAVIMCKSIRKVWWKREVLSLIGF